MVKTGQSEHSALVYAFRVGIKLCNQPLLDMPKVRNFTILYESVGMQRIFAFYDQRRFEGERLNHSELFFQRKFIVLHELDIYSSDVGICMTTKINHKEDATILLVMLM